jgi:glutamyl-tRNA synthetase
VDAYEGVTHALRTSEYRDRAPQFAAVLKMCQAVWKGGTVGDKTASLPDVAIWDYSRLAFSGTVMSKRKLLWFVETGRVEGWDDPRFPTVRGVIRRGLQVPALRSFILAQGASRNVTLQDMDKLWAANRGVVDPLARRHTAIREGGPAGPRVKLTLSGGPAPGAPETVDLPAHKKNPALGTKASTRAAAVWLEQADAAAIAPGEEVTLMDWGNAVVEAVEKDGNGTVLSASGRLHLEGSPKGTRLKLTWLPSDAAAPPLTPLTLVEYGDLLTKKRLEDGEDVADFVNPDSKKTFGAAGDAGLAAFPVGTLVQLERIGYFRVDATGGGDGGGVTLVRIPDGKKGGGGGGGGGGEGK